MQYAAQLLLKFKSKQVFKSDGDVREFFNTVANPLFPQETVTLYLHHGRVFFLLDEDCVLEQEGKRIAIDAIEFIKKIKANELRFELDNQSIRLTLARSLAAAIMSQTHANDLHAELSGDIDSTNIGSHLKENLQDGMVYVAPIVIIMHFILQYTYYYYQTGQWLKWGDPQLLQMYRDSVIVGIQTLMITISIALARAFIPLLLHALDFQFSGPLIHLVIAPIFGLIFASSLLLYDLLARKTAYGQLTISPGTRFAKNFAIGTCLYLVQLFPGLGKLMGFEDLARALLAFAVPNAVNYVSSQLSAWRTKEPAAYTGSQRDLLSPRYSYNFYR